MSANHQTTKSSHTKSFLRWAGSKKKLVPTLVGFMAKDINRYIEPFVGSAQLFFACNPKSAVLSDTNENLINCYLSVRDNPESVFKYLKDFPVGKDEYYVIRAATTDRWDEEKKAARFLYLNTFCFNGLYRTNKAGVFNVPYAEGAPNMISYERLLEISSYLQIAKFQIGDFEKVVDDNCKMGDFVYLDPPYAVRNKDIFLQYGPETFGLSDLNRLAGCLERIDNKEASFLLSYAYCEEALTLAKPWNHRIVTTVRNISGFAKHRKSENEILISNMQFNG